MTGFTAGDDPLTRIFITEYEIIDRFIGSALWTWGNNTSGRLGDGTTTSRSSPGTTAGGGTNWRQVSGGSAHTLAIKTDGTLWTWGFNTNGELGNDIISNRSSPGTTAGGGTNWLQVSGGTTHSAAIKTDGTLWAWGYGNNGAIGDDNGVARSSPVTTNGGGTNWKQVSCGNDFTVAVKTDGTLLAWGLNSSGQLGDGTTTSRLAPINVAGAGTNWRQVSCGNTFTAAVKTDGTLWTWGANPYGELGNGTTTARSSPGTTAGGGTNWKQVSCGSSHTLAIKTDGTLWTWGFNTNGELGTGNATSRSSPGTTAGGGTNWKQVSGGTNHSAAIKTDGTLWTWGGNTSGELGDGTTTPRSSPGTTAGNFLDWKQVSCGAAHTTAITT